MRLPPALRVALLLAPAMLVVGGLFMGGLVAAFVQSLGYFPAIGMTDVSFAAYTGLAQDPAFWRSLGVTVYVAATATALSTLLAVALALGLRDVRGRIAVAAFQLPLTVPHLVAGVAMILLLSQSGVLARMGAAIGLIDGPAEFPALVFDRYYIGVISAYVWKETPFIALVVLAALRGVPPGLEHVAQTLGAGRWQRFRHVILPSITPAVVIASLIVFAFTLGAFEVPLLLGPTTPEMLPVLAYNEYRAIDFSTRPTAMAIAVVTALVAALIAALYLYLGRGQDDQ